MKELMIVLFDKFPLVAIRLADVYKTPSDLLDWYAEHYAIDRARLGYSHVDAIDGPKEKPIHEKQDEPALPAAADGATGA